MNPDGAGNCAPEEQGVDLNRNYFADWNLNLASKNHADPCFEFNAGKEAFSEPESRAVRDILA